MKKKPKSKKARRILVAEELHIVDGKDRSRIILCTGHNDGRPSLQLNDESGFARIQISLGPGGDAGIALLRTDGKGLVGIGANRGSGVGISINDQEGNLAINLACFPDGSRQIDIYDAEGKRVWGDSAPDCRPNKTDKPASRSAT